MERIKSLQPNHNIFHLIEQEFGKDGLYGLLMTGVALVTHGLQSLFGFALDDYEVYFKLGTLFCLLCASFFWVVKLIRFFCGVGVKIYRYLRFGDTNKNKQKVKK